jgi:two-component system, NarL family, sensor histidine kinase BarA
MEDRPPTPSLSQPPTTLAGKRVLIAEDSLMQRLLLSHLLTKAGLTVTLAKNGREAVEWAGRELFDAVLLDMQMPEVDGYEAAAQLRRQGYRGPILALTAETFDGDEQRGLQAGCDAFLSKLMQPTELLGLLASHLALSPALQRSPASTEKSLQDLLRQYVNGLREQMRQMRAALVAEDRGTLALLAHRMRGTAAMYGFPDLAERAGLLEDAVREGQEHDLLAELLGALEAEAAGVVERAE